jgi:hypothetical protein
VQVTQTRGGLYVAEQAVDFQSVAAALREHDPELRLVPQHDPDWGTVVYKVFRYAGDNRPADFVCGWWDREMRPLPLSHRLVDEVKLLDRRTSSRQPDEDEHNERLKQERLDRWSEDMETLADELAKRSRTSPALHRGQHLRRSRHKPGGRWSQ